MNFIWKTSKSTPSNSPSAFSLVEVLVVISIIAALAALTVGLAGRAAESKKTSQVNAEKAVIELAIESYKAKLGFYPPDNPNDPTRPPLFYELTGTQPTNSDYRTYVGTEVISGADVFGYFGRPGFANSQPGEAKNFLENLKAVQYRDIKPNSGASRVKFLVVPVDGPNPVLDIDDKPMNLWRYNSSNPTNNVGHFDLWAEVTIRGRTNIIGNWRK
ncbi:MAG: type II secretion system protein [Opitutaceae bacterium]|nr:type II secretion system protein [Verrucomicrobiales bacterium]